MSDLTEMTPFEAHEHQVLASLGWPRLRENDLGVLAWATSDADFNATMGVIRREQTRVSFSLTRQGLEGPGETLVRGEFRPSESAAATVYWEAVSAQGGENEIPAQEAIALFRHWVDGQAAQPKFSPIGRMESAAPSEAEMSPAAAPSRATRPF